MADQPNVTEPAPATAPAQPPGAQPQAAPDKPVSSLESLMQLMVEQQKRFMDDVRQISERYTQIMDENYKQMLKDNDQLLREAMARDTKPAQG